MYRDQGLTQTFYAKWVLPFVLIIIGAILLLVFFPATSFVIDSNDEEKIYYVSEKDKYVCLNDGYYYKLTTSKGKEVFVITDDKYEGELPKFRKWKFNLSGIGTASGISFCAIGIFMIVINVIKNASSRKDQDHEEE